MAHRQAGRSRELPSGADLSPRELRAVYTRRRDQQSVISRLSRFALRADADELVKRAVEAAHEGLSADSARVLELTEGDLQFRLRAAAGAQHRPDKNVTVHADARTSAGRALHDEEVIIVGNFDDASGFQRLPLFDSPDCLSAIEVQIPGQTRPFGVLGAGCRSANAFTEEDAEFIRTVANIISGAAMRERGEEQLHHATTARHEALAMLSHDLRTPASAIKLSLEVVRRAVTGDGQPIAPEQVERAVINANANLDRMLDMLEARLELDERELNGPQPGDAD